MLDPAVMLPDFEPQMAELVARTKATPPNSRDRAGLDT